MPSEASSEVKPQSMFERPQQQPVLRTSRLILRPFRPEDAPTVERLAGERAIADTTLNIPHPYPEGKASVWIATHALSWATGTLASFAITDGVAGTLLGAVGLKIVPEHNRGELGYWVAVSAWKQGYATEASAELLHLGFAVLGLHRIEAYHLTRNPASGRVLQKLGMRMEGIHRHAVRKWDRFEDLAVYAI